MILSTLINLDHSVFHLINYQWTNGLFDSVLPIWRNAFFWMPIYILIIAFLFHNFGKRSWYLLLFVLFTMVTSDVVSSHLIKKSVKRLRPCNTELSYDSRVLIRCGSGYSFTSSHATNHFALSVFLLLTLGRKIRRLKGPLIFWAASIAYAQVYVGVHYPLDVLMGSLLGTIIATVTAQLYVYFVPNDRLIFT